MDARLAHVALSDEAKAAIRVKAAIAAATPEKKKPIRFKRALLTAVAACLAVVFSLSVAAAVFPDFEHFIRRMGEDLRGKVQPVEVFATDEGIRMDVLAAVHDGESAILYLGLTDEDGAGRIDETTELAWISTGENGFCWGPLVDYDTESGTAIYRVEVPGFGEPIGKEMELTLRSLNTGVNSQNAVDTGLTLADIIAANPKPALAAQADFEQGNGFGVTWGADFDSPLPDQLSAMIDAGDMPLLARDSAPMTPAAPDWLAVGAAGVVDGMLHLQHGPATEVAVHNHMNLTLDWGDPGENVNSLATAEVHLQKYASEGPRDLYDLTETIFELPQGVPAEDIRVLATTIEVAQHITGEWATSFTLAESTPELVATGVENGMLEFSHISVSTIGVKAEFRYRPGAEPTPADGTKRETISLPEDFGQDLEFTVLLKDGTQVKYDSAGMGGDERGNMSATYDFSRPITVSEVDKVLLNGTELTMEYRE